MAEPQVKTQPRVQIYEGMSVETVRKSGSEGQKLMAPLFDTDQDGKFDKYEAEAFNNCNFKTEKGKITIYNRSGYGTEITELKYDNYEEDILGSGKQGKAYNNPDMFHFKNDKGEHCYFSSIGNFAKVVIDMIKGKVHVEGGNQAAFGLYTNNIELTAKNSDLEYITANNSKLNLQNVKDKGLLWDSATEVETDSKTIVNADDNSKVDVKANEEDAE